MREGKGRGKRQNTVKHLCVLLFAWHAELEQEIFCILDSNV